MRLGAHDGAVETVGKALKIAVEAVLWSSLRSLWLSLGGMLHLHFDSWLSAMRVLLLHVSSVITFKRMVVLASRM